MNLQENILRIKQMMGLLTEEENKPVVKGVNHGVVIKQPYYKVVGTSGDSGFGYYYFTKRNTLGVRYREQIFKQIIEKYGLDSYMN